jgi:hypothetical protein
MWGKHVRKCWKASKEILEQRFVKCGKNMLGNIGTAVRKTGTCMLRKVGTGY